MSSLSVVKPISVTDAILVTTDVPENDHAAWNSGTTYALGDRVILTSTHKIYESLAGSNLNKNPVSEPTWWIEVSATNRWKVFDLSNSSQTTKSGGFYYELLPGQAISGVALLNCRSINSVRVRMTDPSFGLVYDQTYTLTSLPSESSWYAWLFEERVEQNQQVILDLPTYPNATLRVDVVGATDAAVGVLLVGSVKTIGLHTLSGARVGIQDYSRKETSEFGDTVLVPRAFAKRASFDLLIDNKQLDNTQTLLASLRATPALWVGEDRYAATVVFGFYREFDIAINYADYSDCSLDLEGLT